MEMKIWEELNKNDSRPDWFTSLPVEISNELVIKRNTSIQQLNHIKLLDL